jgi:hypothetical protein
MRQISVGDSVRAGCGDKPHVRFGRGRLVLLDNQDLASYLTSEAGNVCYMAKGSRSFGGTRPAVCARQGANGRVSTPEDALGMAGEPDTKKLVRPVRREAHRNLVWKQTKALCVHPIVRKAAKQEGM